jgi:NADH dehydrogenase
LSGQARTGAVAITGASGQVGTLLSERLRVRPNPVAVLNRGDDWAAGIESAEAVVHLAGTLQPKGRNTYEAANVDTTEAVAGAVRGGDVQRIVFLSYVGADPASSNAYLRSKGRAEQILQGTGAPVTIFRCVHIYGPPDRPGPTAGAFIAKGRGPVSVPGSGHQWIAPLYIGDVADAVLIAATDPEAPVGTFELGGPDEMTMDQFVRTVNRPGVRLMHLPPVVARGLAHVVPTLTPALMELLLADNVPSADPAETASRFGTELHRLTEIWGAAQPG